MDGSLIGAPIHQVIASQRLDGVVAGGGQAMVIGCLDQPVNQLIVNEMMPAAMT